MSLGSYIGPPPPMIEGKAPQPEDEFARIGPPGTGMGAQAAVEATPEIFGIPENLVSCPHLGVPDHLSWKMLVDQRANRNARTAIEAFQCRTDAETLQLFRKFRIDEAHFDPSRPLSERTSFPAGS